MFRPLSELKSEWLNKNLEPMGATRTRHVCSQRIKWVCEAMHPELLKIEEHSCSQCPGVQVIFTLKYMYISRFNGATGAKTCAAIELKVPEMNSTLDLTLL